MWNKFVRKMDEFLRIGDKFVRRTRDNFFRIWDKDVLPVYFHGNESLFQSECTYRPIGKCVSSYLEVSISY